MRAENVRSSFGATSVIFGSVIGFLIANGLSGRQLSPLDVCLLALWLYSFAGMAQNLLKTAENIVWHVPLRSNLIMLVLLAISAGLIGFYQNILPIDDKVWAALIPAWLFATLLTALIERPSNKELSENV
jgi:hypothetical protein